MQQQSQAQARECRRHMPARRADVRQIVLEQGVPRAS